MRRSRTWPVLTTYDADHLQRIALPIGGIGTGTVSLGGRGDLRDWELMNRPAKGFTPRLTGSDTGPFIAIRAQAHGQAAVTRLAQGPLVASEYEGYRGSPALCHGLPRFRHCRFAAAYPFGQVLLDDPAVPVGVRLEAYNPLIPTDADRSGIPIAVLRVALQNRTDERVAAAVCLSMPNFIGQDGSPGRSTEGENFRAGQKDNRTVWRESPGLRGLYMDSLGVPPTEPSWGTMALTTLSTLGVSHRTRWKSRWGAGLLDFWDDFSADGAVADPPDPETPTIPAASLAVSLDLMPQEERTVTLLLTWHFPNRQTWSPMTAADFPDAADPGAAAAAANTVGNHYATRYTDAWDVAARTARELAALEADSLAWTRAFCASDLPQEVKEAALCNLSTLRCQTSFRIADGTFCGWEGLRDREGSCHGTCTHVWNYEQALPFLYGSLSRSVRYHEFRHAVRDDGFMSFRVNLPVGLAKPFRHAAADGQMGALMKLYRDWRLSGDDAMLHALWPYARKALAFCWIDHGWDPDKDGVMEGCQHNTMDVEYFGPNPQMQSWYLGALRAMEEMATYLGDVATAETCMELYVSGSRWTDGFLFNGEYYEQQVISPRSMSQIAPGLSTRRHSDAELRAPDWQLGTGCLIDQLVGQTMAHFCGLGYLLESANIRAALQSVVRYNTVADFAEFFNCLRSYALPGESGVVMATYPKGDRPTQPFSYFTEVMTGFEYTLAVGLIQEGYIDDGLRVIRDVRARFDGQKRSPFNEAECGHHYARAMASWGAVIAITRFQYCAATAVFSFTDTPGRYTWSSGDAWGDCRITATDTGRRVRITVRLGQLTIAQLALHARMAHRLPHRRTLTPGQHLTLDVD